MKHVQLASGSESMDGSHVVSNAGKVQADFKLDDKAVGKWDVVVTDASGRTARLAGGLEVT